MRPERCMHIKTNMVSFAFICFQTCLSPSFVEFALLFSCLCPSFVLLSCYHLHVFAPVVLSWGN